MTWKRILLRALVVIVTVLAAGAPAAASGPCLCTQRVDFRTSRGPQDWYVTADGSGSLKVTLAIAIMTTNTGQVNPDQLNATIYGPGGALIHTIAVAGNVPHTWVRGDYTVAGTTAGEVYRIEINRSVPHPSPQHASRYYLRFDGGADATIDRIPELNGGRTTWTFHADAGDAMAVRIYDPLTYPNPPGNYPVMYQWIAPNGAAEPVGSYTVPGPGQDTTIPPPAGLVPGKWRLRLQTLSFTGTGWGYGIEKLTGGDRRIHVEPGLAGLGGGGRVRLVDQSGNPFPDAVGFTFGFGESFTFPLVGTFETLNDSDTFPIPITITPPPGLVATPSSFAFLSPCDGFFEQVVVIAPPPPAIAVSVASNVLWPPNNKMVPIAVNIATSSPDGHATTVELVSITSNESVAGNVAGASFGTDDRSFEVRAQRDGGGSGRTYTATYRVTDTVTGLSATASATVYVPHDQGK